MNRTAAMAASWKSAAAAAEASAAPANIAVLLAFEIDGVDDRLSAPILRYPNFIATPHIWGVTSDSLVDIATGVTQNIERLRAG